MEASREGGMIWDFRAHGALRKYAGLRIVQHLSYQRSRKCMRGRIVRVVTLPTDVDKVAMGRDGMVE